MRLHDAVTVGVTLTVATGLSALLDEELLWSDIGRGDGGRGQGQNTENLTMH
jgi:hypothetical protein